MAPSIDIDDDVFAYLKEHAEPFVDTPNSVLRRLMQLDGSEAGHSLGETRERRHPAASKKRRDPKLDIPRAAAGTLLPEESYELPLLDALASFGGTAPYGDVVDKVGELLGDRLTPADRDTLKSGGVRWKSRVQFVRLRLIERGLMDRETPRGLWGITDAGRTALKEGRTK